MPSSQIYRSRLSLQCVILLNITLAITSCGSSPDSVTSLPAATGATVNMLRLQAPAEFGFIDRVGTTENPFSKGTVDVPSSEMLTVFGWAVDPDIKLAATEVDIAIDGVPYAARYGLDRPDVAAHFKSPACARSGVEFSMPAKLLPAGDHQLTMRVVPPSKSGYYETPALKLRVK